MSHDDPEPVEQTTNECGIPSSPVPPTAAPSDEAPARAEEASSDEGDERVMEDWRWVFAGRNDGRFNQYRGRHIAVVGKKVVGSDDDPRRLRHAVAATLHLHPEHVVVAYVDDP